MIRDLLYSIFFHTIMFGLLFLSTTTFTLKHDVKTFTKADVTPMVINFIDDGMVNEIESIKTTHTNDMVKDMSIDQKIDLYKKIKNNKIIDTTIKNYEKTGKKVRAASNDTNETIIYEDDNEFTYHFTPIYVSEKKLNETDRKILLDNHLKKEELRRKMKEKGAVPALDLTQAEVNANTNLAVGDIKTAVETAKKEIVIKDSKTKVEATKKDAKKDNKKQKKEVVDGKDYIDEMDDLALKIFMEQNALEDEYKNLTENEIFSEEDLKKLKEISGDSTKKFSLTMRERRNIQQQIKICYKNAILKNKKDSKTIINAIVSVKKDGIIDLRNLVVDNPPKNADKNYDIAFLNVKTALVFCSPLRGMPSGKYDLWKRMMLVFDSSNLD